MPNRSVEIPTENQDLRQTVSRTTLDHSMSSLPIDLGALPKAKRRKRPLPSPSEMSEKISRLLSTEMIDTRLAAAFLGQGYQTLCNWRVKNSKRGPHFHKGEGKRGSVRYLVADLIAWRDSRRRTSTSDNGGSND